MKLCNRIKIKSPTEEAPVNIKNFFNFPSTFSFRVKNIKARPKRKKTRSGSKKRREPFNIPLTAGMKNSLAITRKTPTNAQNITGAKFFFINFILPKNRPRFHRLMTWGLTY